MLLFMQSSIGLLSILQVIYEYGDPRWNDRGKPKNSEKNLCQCHFEGENITCVLEIYSKNFQLFSSYKCNSKEEKWRLCLTTNQ
jgi:hypothetical protein